MTLESARAFLERIKTDEAFKKEYLQQENKDSFLKAKGYLFTEKEIQTLQNEVSSEELMSVAGGGCTFHCNNLTGTNPNGCAEVCEYYCSSD